MPAINWLISHWAVLGPILCALVVAVIDLVMALNPGLKGNGILHQIYVLAQKESENKPPAAQ